MKTLATCILLIIISCNRRDAETTGLEGKVIPEFSILLPDSATWLNTKQVNLQNSTVVFLFSPDCPYSKQQMKNIVDNIDALKNIHFYVITPFPFSKMKLFYDNYKIAHYSNITMGIDTSNFYGTYMNATAVPFLAFYKDGKLRKAFVGNMSIDLIKSISNDL